MSSSLRAQKTDFPHEKTCVKNSFQWPCLLCCVAGYGVNYGETKWKENLMMKEFCKEALRYGEMGVSGGPPSYRVTVILNPAADKTRARCGSFTQNYVPIHTYWRFPLLFIKVVSRLSMKNAGTTILTSLHLFGKSSISTVYLWYPDHVPRRRRKRNRERKFSFVLYNAYDKQTNPLVLHYI